ncbi:MAG: signal peptidase I [Candidatus Cloacimonetes bacterium]|nr:signal peptidase I [Candidatus Cloacimonadota bacterium]MBL7086546.1 signal peptidase I [Candidatus Cloacimonadota bacterium]
MSKKAKKKLKKKKSVIREWIEAIIFAGIAAIIIRTFVIQTFKIPTGSMEQTFLIGDFLIANKFIFYFREPKQFEPIIFKYPLDTYHPQPKERYAEIIRPIYWDKKNFFFKYYKRRDFIKRIIGMPGDTLQIINKNVYINGKYIKEDYAQHIDYHIISREKGHLYINSEFMGSRDNFGPLVVPEGKYFLMGDNRDNSSDSRYWGFLDRKLITGTPMIIYWSWGKHHRIRWRRLLKIV